MRALPGQQNPTFDALAQGWAGLQNEALGLEVDQSNLRHDKLLTEVRHLYKSITAASREAQEGVGLAQEAQQAFGAITERVGSMVDTNLVIASAIEQQGAVVNEIERNVVRISDGSDEALQVANAARDAARQIHQLTEQLRAMVQSFVL